MARWPALLDANRIAVGADAAPLAVLLGTAPPSFAKRRNIGCIAASDGLVFAASKQRIFAIDPHTCRVELLVPVFGEIVGLACDRHGGLLVSDRQHRRVTRLDLATGELDRSVPIAHPGPIACVGDRMFVVSPKPYIVEIDRAFGGSTAFVGGGHMITDGRGAAAGFRHIHSLAEHRGALYAGDHHELRRIELATADVTSLRDYRLGELQTLASDGTYLYGSRVSLERLGPDDDVTTLSRDRVGALACLAGELFAASGSQLARVDGLTGKTTDVALPADYVDDYGGVTGIVALGGTQLALAIRWPPTVAIVDLATGEHDAIRIARARGLTALAFDGGDRLYTCDQECGVSCIAFGARTVAQIPGIAAADEPYAIAVGAPDQLVVALRAKRQLVALDLATGTSTVLAELAAPVELAYDGRGAVYVSGAGIVKIDLVTHAKTLVTNAIIGGHVAVAPTGELYVGEGPRVMRVAPNGDLATIAGRPGSIELELGELPGSLGRIGALAFLHDGTLAAVDRDHGVVLRARLPR